MSPSPPRWLPNFGAPDLELELPSTSVPTVADVLRNTSAGPASNLRALALGETGPAGRDLLTAAAVDEPVVVLEQPVPRYPAALAEAGIAGSIEVTFVVDTLGRAEPGSLRTLQSPHPAFEAAAHASVLASRFRPARLKGRVVRQLVRQTLSFRPSVE